MAGRPKTTVKAETIAINESPDVTAQDALKKENDELKAQLKALMDKFSDIESKLETVASKKEETLVTDEINYESDLLDFKDINPNKPIMVMSLTDGDVWLKTSIPSKNFHFDKFGHRKPITYSDLQDVIAMNRSFIEDGVVYICDKDVVKNNYLDEYYKKFLTVDMITNILSFSNEKIEQLVTNTTPSIQETIISILVKKINSNEWVDQNKISVIGRSCNPPCDINELALKQRKSL